MQLLQTGKQATDSQSDNDVINVELFLLNFIGC